MRKSDSIFRGRIFQLSILALVLAATPALLALEPPRPGQIEQYRADGTLAQHIADAYAIGNHRIGPQLAARIQARLDEMARQIGGDSGATPQEPMVLPLAWQGMPTRGVVHVPVFLIAFQDYQPTIPAATITSKLFGDGDGGYPYESLRNYYLRSSYNQLEIQGSVLGWYTTPYPRSQVVETTNGRENLLREAIQYFDAAGHDFSQYDNDGDGFIDYFIVFWTGPHGAWASFWWGYMTSFSNQSFTVDGKRLAGYSWQWELYDPNNPVFETNTVIHETGHAMGLPDYYDYDDTVGPDGGLGGLDMMDGTYGDHNCFSKWLLDWVSPTVYNDGQHDIQLAPAAQAPEAAVIMPGDPDGLPFREFFMVQYRNRTGNDTGYPTDGLLIWHVDARLDSAGYNYLYDNSYTDHKLLRLMEADGLEQIERFGWANAGDYYEAGDVFGPDSVPNSDRYDGAPTNMTVDGITAPDSTMGFHLTFDQEAPILQDVNLCVSSDACVITWSTNEWTDALVDWGPDPGLGALVSGEGFAMQHSVRLSDLQPGTTYIFKLYSQDLTGNGNETGYFHFTTAGTSPAPVDVFSDDMESDSAKWFRIPGGPGPWSIVSTSYAHSASHAWYSSDPSIGKDDLLMTQPIDLTNAAAASLVFFQTFQTETGYDGGVVEASVDGGDTFFDIGPDIETGGYSGLISPFTQSSIRGRPAWTGGALGTMQPVVASLNRFVGNSVILRFRMACDSNTPGLGWYVDDVTVQASACTAAAPVPGLPAGGGDLDGDTFVDAADLLVLANFLSENLGVIPSGMYQADLNADARVDVVDSVLLANILAGNL
jgi:M6 family metalloprotease-like protein